MKKKLALLLSVLSCVMLLGACGTEDPTKVEYNGVSYEELYMQSYSIVASYGAAPEEMIEQQLAYYEENYPEEAALDIQLCTKWLEAIDVCGEFVAIKEDGFSVEKSGKTLTTDLILEFENRDVIFQLVYNYHDMELTGITVEPVYSLGEKMTKAGLNTIICMSIVFAVLIFISLIISCFNIFPYLETKKKEKEAALRAAENKDEVITQIEQREEQESSDDTELVAVIAAAIAAYEGTSTDNFVVRSIRRR